MAEATRTRNPQAGLAVREADGKTVLEPSGDWVIDTIGKFESAIAKVEATVKPGDLVIDFDRLERIDTAGAYLLGRPLANCDDPDGAFHFTGEHETARRLIREVRERTEPCPVEEEDRAGFMSAIERIGEGTLAALEEAYDTIAFFGRTVATGWRTIGDPRRLRWTPTVYLMETAGVNALPIIALLAFFIGAVVAFMGANLLETFGAAVFTVELVGISILREFGVLITAIMLAGRSDSAFTAAIGSMKMQQEIDAMKVIGLDPYEALVIPRVIACVVMAPLLTFAAMLAGIFGGMLVAWSTLDIAPGFFVARLQQTLDWSHFWVGLSKAPVFGAVIAIIGCRQGMEVGGDVESLGRRTTASVVQSIFAVIVIDALFAMMYLELGI